MGVREDRIALFGFVAFCVLDAALTKMALADGGCSELNPIALLNPWWRANIALAIVLGLYLCKKQRLILPLCIGMGAICCWNVGMILTARIIG